MNDYKRKKHKSDKPLTIAEELLKENERLRCGDRFAKKVTSLLKPAKIKSHNGVKA